MKSAIYPKSRKEWRCWLLKNHTKENEVWLVYYKKHTGKPTISYADSVEEALCFGWIDGLKKSIDIEKYAHRFSPRKPGSKWSPVNTKLAKKLIEEGKMTEAGLAAFNQRVSYDQLVLKTGEIQELSLTPEIEAGLKGNLIAWNNFNNLAPGYRKQYLGWLLNAKKPETREKRLKEAIELLAKNEKLGMK